MDDATFDPKRDGLDRIEVITGVSGRRRWPKAVKARIVAESFAGEGSVSEVARRHGIRPQQLFGWRQQARAGRLALAGAGLPPFVPIVADAARQRHAHPLHRVWLPLQHLESRVLAVGTVGIFGFIGAEVADWHKVMAFSSLFVLPILALFLVLQSKIVSGITAGALK
jgi:transposase-like protein